MDQISDLIAKHGFTAGVAVYFLWLNYQDKKISRIDLDRMHKEIESLKGQHFQIQKDIASTLRETNRLVKRIFNIVDRGDGRGGDGSDTFVPSAAASSEVPTEQYKKKP